MSHPHEWGYLPYGHLQRAGDASTPASSANAGVLRTGRGGVKFGRMISYVSDAFKQGID